MHKVYQVVALKFYIATNESIDDIKKRAHMVREQMTNKFGEYASISLRKVGYYPPNQSMYFLYTLTFESQRRFNVFKLKSPHEFQIMEKMKDNLIQRLEEDGILDTEAFEDLLYDEM